MNAPRRGATSAPRRRMVKISASQICAPLPAPNWTVEELQLCPGRPNVLGGYSSSGKTLALQSLALCAATGRLVWGHFKVPKPLRVLHIDYEQGPYATPRRYQRFAAGLGIEAEEWRDIEARRALEAVIFPDVFLPDPDAYQELLGAFEGVDLVVLDALRGALGAEDENDSKTRRFVHLLTRASAEQGCTVVAIHHGKKEGKKVRGQSADPRELFRGSSALFDEFGSAFWLAAPAERGEPFEVSHVKPNPSADDGLIEPFFLKVSSVQTEHEIKGLSVRWVAHEVVRPPVDPEKQRQDLERRLLSAIGEEPGKGRAHLAKAVTANRTKVNESLGLLEEERRIVDRGMPGRPAYYLPGTE